MTELDARWEALAALQPGADAGGYGTEWATMLRERTADSAMAASDAARDAADVASDADDGTASATAIAASDAAYDAAAKAR